MEAGPIVVDPTVRKRPRRSSSCTYTRPPGCGLRLLPLKVIRLWRGRPALMRSRSGSFTSLSLLWMGAEVCQMARNEAFWPSLVCQLT